MKRICKSNSQKMIVGVCGGIAEYEGCNPNTVRLLFVLLSLVSGVGVLLYILMAIYLPSSERV